MKTIKLDITAIEKGVIISQVNCQNAMGSGLARAIYEKWPVVKTKYHEFCEINSKMGSVFDKNPLGDLDLLGKIQEISVQYDPQITVINVFGQLNYGGGAKTGVRYTDYGALKTAFEKIKRRIINSRHHQDLFDKYRVYETAELLPLYIPKFLGAGLGGGDYKTIHRLIEHYLPDAILVDF